MDREKQKENNYYNNYNINNNKYNNYYNNDNEYNYQNKYMNNKNNYKDNYNNNNQNYNNDGNTHGYNSNYNNYNNYNSQNLKKKYNNNNIKIIHYHLNDGSEQTIKVIKIPTINEYKPSNNNYNTNNNNYNYYKNRINNLYNNNPFSFFDEEFNFNFDIDDPFNFFESRLNNIYGIRILSENNKKKLNLNIFSTKKHELLFIPNNYYFDYIEYLPKSTIILIPKQYANQMQKYEDYYIFTVDETISLISAISKCSNNYHLVKLGQNYTDSNFIIISISVTIFICFIGSLIYSIFLKHSELYDILPVQKIASKLPIYLCLLNLLICLYFMGSYHESDGYFVIIKYLCLFLYSLFRSIILSILTLLLNGWMTLSFVGWAEKLNRVIPILLFEIISSISFEIIDFYNILPYNKIQLYYFRNILENIIICFISFISFYKYYIPLYQKCKYLNIINSEFNSAYKLKKRKILSYIIFSLFYAFISIYSNYLEFSFIYKYIQNDNLHIIKQVIFESVFNFIFIIILLPMKLPYLFIEETDLLSFGYYFTNLNDKKEILDINDKNFKDIKKEVEDNGDIPIIVVNPFFNPNGGFEEIHTGKISSE